MELETIQKWQKNTVKLTIKPRFQSDFSLNIEAIVLDNLPKVNCPQAISVNYPHLCNLTLADPSINQNHTIDLLLGAHEYAKLLKNGLIKGSADQPIAQNTEFGWVISGNTANARTVQTIALPSTVEIEDALAKFFETDQVIEERINIMRTALRYAY